MHPRTLAMLWLVTHSEPEVMEAAVDDFLLSLGLNPGPTNAYG